MRWFLPFIATFAATASQQSPQADVSIRVPVRLVNVPTLVVSRDGKYLPGLTAANFQLRADSVPQKFQLDSESLSVSVAIALQCDADVRDYLPFVLKVGSLLSDSLAASRGQTALIRYNDEIEVALPFAPDNDLRAALLKSKGGGHQARLADAGLEAIELLRREPAGSSRVLLFIGQAVDHGSQHKLAELLETAERENVQVFALRLPLLTRSWLSETFGFQTLGSQWYKGGYQARAELTTLVPALRRARQEADGADPFSVLTTATGGLQLPFRKQRALEDGIIAIGTALRSRYFLTFTPPPPRPDAAREHAIQVTVDLPGAKVYARPGYLSGIDR